MHVFDFFRHKLQAVGTLKYLFIYLFSNQLQQYCTKNKHKVVNVDVHNWRVTKADVEISELNLALLMLLINAAIQHYKIIKNASSEFQSPSGT